MTIRDIAAKAGVSPATVSRIMNHKDQNISDETRERVMRIIKEQDYVPYAKLRDRLLSNSHVIGLVIPTLTASFYAAFASSVQKYAQEKGYTILLSITEGDYKTETAVLNSFNGGKVEGILFFPCSKAGLLAIDSYREDGRSAVVLDCAAQSSVFPQIYRDRKRNARRCTQQLLEHCGRVALLLRAESGELAAQQIRSGYETALVSRNLVFDPGLVISTRGDFEKSVDTLVEIGVDGFVCEDADLAGCLYAVMAKKCIRIPEDLSIVAMEDAPLAEELTPALSAWRTDPEAMAKAAVDALLWQCHQEKPDFTSRMEPSHFEQRQSITEQKTHSPRIAIVGSMNMDIVLQVPSLPHAGEIMMVPRMMAWPGGKGANQALSVSRLGGSAYMLGSLGNDHYGRQIYEKLSTTCVDMTGVSMTANLPTGTAYISVAKDGCSAILVHAGANNALNGEYVQRHSALLRSARYCLVQMEIPLDAVCQTVQLCREAEVSVILKPSPAQHLPDNLLDGLYLLVPNEEEAEAICPEGRNLREKAQRLLERGVQNVIITMGSSGCLWASTSGTRTFPAHPYPCVDSTGASDVFIGCLAVMLTEENSMEEAIAAASWAASYSVSHEGVQNSVPERRLLDEFLAYAAE